MAQCGVAADATLRHLQWTLAYPWQNHRGVLSTAGAATLTWRGDQALQHARDAMRSGDPWTALLEARAALGLDPAFRQTTAHCRGRYYGWRPGLGRRLVAKLRHELRSDDPCARPARAVRAWLDMVHVHPFVDGNGRSAVLLASWVLDSRPCFEAVLRVPQPPGDSRVPPLMLAAMGAT